ncbi:MAG: hypothetical protein BJ554DRAFT_7446 [Olpidium bornovanus]|uniref:Uncharacterized protein n=1 Tax=Olpidium bornovanus TaxID=278681 RepID=A0A8H8A1T7_9FUNG|nr:MAG: hypothetical protein BJ554DRAFT_7446 [Olpidium bornovanus]
MSSLAAAPAAARAAAAAAAAAGRARTASRSAHSAVRKFHATCRGGSAFDRILALARGHRQNTPDDGKEQPPKSPPEPSTPEGSAVGLRWLPRLDGLGVTATAPTTALRPYPGEPVREELIATEEGKAQISSIDLKLTALDELSEEAALLRQERRNLLLPFRQQCEAEDVKRWKAEEAVQLSEPQTASGALQTGIEPTITCTLVALFGSHRVEREKNPAKPRIIYFWRHIPMGKIYVTDTQFLDYKQFHHQTSLKRFERIIRLRRDHWEPLLAVTGLPYAADVKRIIEQSLCPDKQVKQREGFRKLRENRGTRQAPGPKPPKAMIRATESLEFSKKSVTRLAKALRELQEDMGDLHTAGIRIWWSREADQRILLCAGVNTRKELLTSGKWPDLIQHCKLETDRSNIHIMNIHEDITYEVENRRRFFWRQKMVEPGELWYPKRDPGRKGWLARQWARKDVNSLYG